MQEVHVKDHINRLHVVISSPKQLPLTHIVLVHLTIDKM